MIVCQGKEIASKNNFSTKMYVKRKKWRKTNTKSKGPQNDLFSTNSSPVERGRRRIIEKDEEHPFTDHQVEYRNTDNSEYTIHDVADLPAAFF